MTRYVAFLRGINVSGQKIIPMALLKEIFEGLKFANVATFIQSGNVIFDSKIATDTKLTTTIERGLNNELGYDVDVILRPIRTLTDLVASDPFAGKIVEGKAKPYVTFVKSEPQKPLVSPFVSAKKEITVIGVNALDVYCLSHPLPNGTWGFPNAIIEKEYGVAATTRNWNTLSKIAAKFGM